MSGKMTVLENPSKVYEYNGLPEERAGVEAEFNRLMETGMFLAFMTVVEKDKKERVMIKEFPKKDGKEETEVLLTPRLVGG